jgi:hypothetical protein
MGGAPPEGRGPGGERRPDSGGPGSLGDTETIMISVHNDEVRITSDDGHVRILTPDATPVERVRGFETVTETARWDGRRIVVTATTQKGTLITETFSLDEDGSGRFVHSAQFADPWSNKPRTVRWVYDRSTDSESGRGHGQR